MARKEIDILIDADGGLDANKTFILKKMGAEQAQNWIIKATCAIKKADPNADIDFRMSPDDFIKSALSILYKGNPFEIIALLDELMTCVKFRYEAGKPPMVLAPSAIEEVFTRIHLQREAFFLSMGFLLPGKAPK